MKKSLLTLTFALVALFAAAQPPQGQPSQPNANRDSLSPRTIFGPLFKRIQVHGYLQAGYEFNNKLGDNSNEFNFKRSNIVAFAQITDRWNFFFMHDFNSEVQEFYTDFRITKGKGLNIRFGQMKNSFGLENPYNPEQLELVDVTSQATTYLGGTYDPLFSNKVMFGRDLGVMLFGEIFNSKLKYELAVMNGQGINIKDKNNKKDYLAKLDFYAMPNLRFLVSGQLGTGCAADFHLSDKFVSPYNQSILPGENYRRDRWSIGSEYKSFVNNPQIEWKRRPLSIRGEVMGGVDGEVNSLGGYATATIPLFATFDAIASYDYINYNTDEDMQSTKYIIGLQYWFYSNCRIQLQYTRGILENLSAGEPTIIPNPQGPPTIIPNLQPDYDMVQLQIQVGF